MWEHSADRRQFLNATLIAMAAAGLGRFGFAGVQSGGFLEATGTMKAGTNGSFGALKQIDAGVLKVSYAEASPANGKPVVLLHGWPYDIHNGR